MSTFHIPYVLHAPKSLSTAMSVVSLAWLMGCPTAQQLQRCNADVDCDIGLSCQDGTCVVDDTLDPGGTPNPGVAPESDSGPPPDGGPGDVDGGPINRDGGPGPNDGGDDGGLLRDSGPINNDGGPSDWWDSNWSSRRAVVVSLPAVVDEALSDVPVLVTLSFEDVPGVSQDFSDVRFVDVNGNLLNFEREGYADDGAAFWVAFASLSPGVNAEIYVYWGNEGASALPYASDVWRNGYKGVWNLNNDLQNHADVTLRAPTLLRGADILFTSGGGLNLDGSNEVAVVANNSDIAQDVDVVTISARFRAESTGRHQIIAAISVGSASTDDRSRASIALIEGAGFQIYGRHHDNEPYVDHETPLDLYAADEWNHVVGILDYVGGVVEVYLNGVLVFSEEQTFDQQPNDRPARRIVIGGEDDTNGAHFGGVIDDVRISDVRRSPAWIAFEAAQQAGVFVLGASETRPRIEVGQPPVATNDNFELVEDAAQTFFTLTDNDSDDDGVNGFDYLFIDSLGDSTLGTLQITPDGRGIAFEPFSNAFGSEDIAYTVSDGVNGIDDGVVAINVASVNDIPNARFDRASVRVGETALVDVRANDSDIETASDGFIVEVLTEAARASVVEGQIVFETDGLVAGESIEVRYRITDDDGGSDTSTLYIGMHASPASLGFLDYSGLFSHGISGRPYGMSVVDINHDGILDVATIGGSGSRVSLGSEDLLLQEIYEGPNGRALQFANIDNTGPMEFVNTDEDEVFTLVDGAIVEVNNAADFSLGVDSMVWNDYDGDGDIDMFVVDRDDPFVYFKENDLELSFVDDVTKLAGPDLDRGMSTSADINGDGRADFLIIADRPYLFVSGANEGYVDETDARGLGGVSTSDVGVSFGDCDNDGDLDLFIGARYDSSPKLFINDQGVFEEKASFNFRAVNAVGVALGDIDNDGDLDAFIGEGNSGSPIKYDHGSLMLLNDGNCNFVDVAYELGLDAQSAPIAGAVLVDSDRDGDLDLLANRYSASSVGVYVNQLSHNFSFRVVVRGAGGPQRSPVDGHGTEVFLTTAAPGNTTITQMRHISGGEGYYSQGPNEAHFGLGAADPASVDVLVRFSSGVEVPLTITNLAASVDDGPRSIIVTEPPLVTP